MHQYWGFGLNIESPIDFPELMPCSFDTPDVRISMDAVPSELKGENVICKVHMSASAHEYLLDVKNIAKYYAANGNTVIIETYPGADIPSVRLFMLSNAMAALLHQRNMIPFHASGILSRDGVILFTGRSGAGKSTTVYGLMQHGYELFTDDVCVLSQNKESGTIEAVASYPMMKLWENTINQIAADESKAHQLRPQLAKFGLFQHQRFQTHPLPVKAVYVLKPDNLQQAYTCKPLNALAAFNELQQNTYRRRQIDMMNLREAHFGIISRLTQQAKVTEVLRPPSHSNIAEFLTYIRQLIDSHAEA